MATDIQTVNVAIRRNRETGDLELFYVNSYDFSGFYWIECFNPKEGTGEVSRHYMTQRCGKPLPADDPQAVALANNWGTCGAEKYRTRIVKTLRGPKNFVYGGE